MPTYEFHCHTCGRDTEEVRPIGNRNDPAHCRCGAIAVREIRTPAMGQPDIKPYIAQAGDMRGRPITSRREHKEFLARNRLVEAGDMKVPDKPLPMRKVTSSSKDTQERRNEIRRQLHKRFDSATLARTR